MSAPDAADRQRRRDASLSVSPVIRPAIRPDPQPPVPRIVAYAPLALGLLALAWFCFWAFAPLTLVSR